MRFAVVAGARPNFMKIAPLLLALDRSGFETRLIHTGQHYDRNMSDVFFEELGIRKPDVNFDVGAAGQSEQTGRIMSSLESWLDGNPVDGLLVVGDVTSTLACTIVAAKRLIPVGHVEAGLRSFDRTMPEEVNRVVVDALSTWLFTPSADADLELAAEGVEPARIHLVGNIMVDSLFNCLDRAIERSTASRLGVDGPYSLATLHRPALVDDPARFRPVLDALRDVAAEQPVIFPIHPRTLARLEAAGLDDRLDAFVVSEPLGYLDFLSLEHGASLVLTDSGGVQEETTALGRALPDAAGEHRAPDHDRRGHEPARRARRCPHPRGGSGDSRGSAAAPPPGALGRSGRRPHRRRAAERRPGPDVATPRPHRERNGPHMSDSETTTEDTTALPRTVIVGQGYVGLPLAMRALEAGHQVVGYDVDVQRTSTLAAGRSFIEDITDYDITAALATGRYLPTSDHRDCAGFDHLVITVPTPLREGTPDLSYVEGASADIARYVRPGSVVILESTTYPGTTDELVAPILQEISGLVAGVDFHLGYSPERIDPGNATWTLANTPKVVAGINPESLEAVDAFYRQIVSTTVPVSQMRVAELTKLIENTFRHVNIALANELAVFAADLDIDIWEAIDAASTKPYGFMRFTPGPGVGGHCLPIDPSYLSWQVRRSLGRAFRFVELANDINEHMPDYVVTRLMRLLNEQGIAMSRAQVLVLGLAYKKNSSDPRESPAIEIVEQLQQMGSKVHVADPHVVEERFIPHGAVSVEVTEQEIRDADVVVLVTDHDGFPYEMIASEAKAIFDTRARMTGPNVTRL